MKSKSFRLLTALIMSLCIMLSMAPLSVFAAVDRDALVSEIDAVSAEAMAIMYPDEDGPEYTAKSVKAVTSAHKALMEVLQKAVEDKVTTEEELEQIQAKIPPLKKAVNAAVLKTEIKVSNTSKKISAAKLKKKAQSFTIKAKVSSGAKAKFKKASGSKKVTVSKTGKVTVKKGTKKGKYTVKVKISVPATSKAEAKTKTVKVNITVK